MNKSGKWFAIFVIVLFLMSMFSVILWKVSDSSSQEKEIIEDPLNSIPITFNATSKGKVIELPTNNMYLVYAKTNNPDVSSLDTILKAESNIMNVSSQLQILDANEDFDYMYLAYLSTDDNVDYFSLHSYISDINDFGIFEIYPYALVEYDSFLKFENTDLNLTKELSLGGSNIIILVDGYTLLNDEVEFIVTASFTGNKLSNYNAILTNNLTSAPKVIQSIYTGNFLPKEYVYEIDGNYSKEFFSFIDYNFEYYNNDKTYLVFFKDYSSQIDSKLKNNLESYEKYVSGFVYVNDINYLGENISIDSNLYVTSYDLNNNLIYGLPYNKINTKNSYRLELTFIRNNYSTGNAVYLGDLNV
jgi:ABC-type glycerol-3-phosphate transport system permease component